MSSEFDVVSLLWPAPEPGKPYDIEARLLERDVEIAMSGLPPRTLAQWPPWPAADRAARLDVLERHAELEDLFRTLPNYQHILFDQVLPTLPVDQAAQIVSDHPSSELAVLRHVVALCEAAETAHRASASSGDFDAITAESYLAWARERLAQIRPLIPDDHYWTWVLEEHVCFLSQDEAGAQAGAAQWKMRAPLDLFAWQRHVRFRAARTNLRDAWNLAVSICESAPVGNDVHALVPFCAALCFEAIEEDKRGVSMAGLEEAVVKAYYRCGGSPHYQPSVMSGWARNQFAGMLHVFGQDDLAWNELLATRGHVTPVPWVMISPESGPTYYDEARRYHVRRLLRQRRMV